MIKTIDRPMLEGEPHRIIEPLILSGRVLDLGCGHRHFTHTRTDTIWVDIDIAKHATDPRVICLDARDMPKVLRRMRFSTILMLDLIEHMPKRDGTKLLDALEKMTSRIVICTPVGELWIPDTPDLEDPHTHKSGWTPQELAARGYECLVYPHMHGPNTGGFYAWKDCATNTR